MGEPPRPKSPPGYVDLYGKRRQQAKLQVLEREISFLQEELKSLEAVQPTSRSCKELNEFLAAKPDPLIAVHQKNAEADCSWKRISGCCQSHDANRQQAKKNRGWCCCCCSGEHSCPKCSGCSCFHKSCCCFKLSCSSNCCKVKLCPDCVMSCCGSCCC